MAGRPGEPLRTDGASEVDTDFSLDKGYEQLLALNQAAFAGGHHEVAYHALMAALHCAEQARDLSRLADVSRRCREQLQAIDRIAPAHRLSSQSARAAGHRSVFEMGASTADAAALRLQAELRLAERRHRR
jgi:hypothetical protein